MLILCFAKRSRDAYLILILLFSLSSSEERSWSDAEHHESSLLADCVEVLDLVAFKVGWCCLCVCPTVSIFVGPTSSHDLHLERGSSEINRHRFKMHSQRQLDLLRKYKIINVIIHNETILKRSESSFLYRIPRYTSTSDCYIANHCDW